MERKRAHPPCRSLQEGWEHGEPNRGRDDSSRVPGNQGPGISGEPEKVRGSDKGKSLEEIRRRLKK